MTTNADFINDTFRLLGVVPEVGAASAEQADIAARVLNDMLSEWEALGLDIQSAPIQNLEDDCEIEQTNRQTVKYNLAVRLYGIYPREQGLRPDIVAIAQSGYDRLVRDAVSAAMQPSDMSHLPAGEGNWPYFDITR